MKLVRIAIAAALAGATLLAVAPAAAQDRGNPSRDMMLQLGAGMKGDKLKRAIEKAEEHPLGTKQNPVRENQPGGQRAYLARLRCADGSAPGFDRAGNVGEGPYGFIVDLYKVTCAGQAAVDVYIDMYHDGPENRPVPGFTIVGGAGEGEAPAI